MLRAENLVKTFERNEKHKKKTMFNAVDGISISVSPGEIVGVLGPNGAGKTTLLRMLGCLMSPSAGTVEVEADGKLLTSEQEIKRRIGYLSGNTKLYARLSTRELLATLGGVYGLSEEAIIARVERISTLLDMRSFLDNRIEKLSTGQTQRASISRCLIHDPEIYIFDEPTLGLDIISSAAIVNFMKGEKERGKAVLYSTHYLEEAEFLCDRVIMIDQGKIIAQGSVDALKEKTKSASLREVFMKLMEPSGQRLEGGNES